MHDIRVGQVSATITSTSPHVSLVAQTSCSSSVKHSQILLLHTAEEASSSSMLVALVSVVLVVLPLSEHI